MPSSLQALLAIALAVLPGALFVWGFEREAGNWGIGLSDTVLRFVAASAAFQAVFGPLLYMLYRAYVHDRLVVNGHVRYDDHLADGTAPWWLGLVPAVYVFTPALLGTVAGRCVHSDRRGAKAFARVIAGRDPAPRAWDALLASRPAGTVRIRLNDGSWVGGAFGADSYAAGYPERPQDLLLETTYLMQSDGAFARTDGGDFVGSDPSSCSTGTVPTSWSSSRSRRRLGALRTMGKLVPMEKRGGYTGSAPKVAPKPPTMPGASSNPPAPRPKP